MTNPNQPQPNQPQQQNAVRSTLSRLSNNQLYIGAIVLVAVILWIFRTLNWVVIKDKTDPDFPKVGAVDGAGNVEFFYDMSINWHILGIYTGALLFLMILAAIISVFSVHASAGRRLGVGALIAYAVLTVLQFFIPVFAVLSNEDSSEQIALRPGFGILMTWLFLGLILAGVIYMRSLNKPSAPANPVQQWQPAPTTETYSETSPVVEAQPEKNPWTTSDEDPQDKNKPNPWA